MGSPPPLTIMDFITFPPPRWRQFPVVVGYFLASSRRCKPLNGGAGDDAISAQLGR